MGTTVYFDGEVRDEFSKRPTPIAIGTTGYAGEGPRLYLKLGEESLIMSHDDAKAFCAAAEQVALYFGFGD